MKMQIEKNRNAGMCLSHKFLIFNHISDYPAIPLRQFADTVWTKAGILKAKIIGRGYKVKRQDLDDFVKNL